MTPSRLVARKHSVPTGCRSWSHPPGVVKTQPPTYVLPKQSTLCTTIQQPSNYGNGGKGRLGYQDAWQV
jgi:hypothetical protein